jgi:hypothetical protein
MRRPLLAIAFVVVVALHATPAAAHHSFAAEYDATKRVTLTGVMTKVSWLNPHVWLYIAVAGADGKVITWAIELRAPGVLHRHGWRPRDLPVGSKVTVEGWPARNGSPTLSGTRVLLPDGRQLLAGS